MGESRRANRFKATIRRPVFSGGESMERGFIQILSFLSWKILQEGGKDGWIR